MFTNFAANEAVQTVSYNVPWFMYAAIVFALIGYAILEYFHGRKDHVIGFKEAVRWSVFYISIAILFAVPVYFFIAPQASAEYMAAWAIEKALSLDNLFVFSLIFAAFKVEQKYRRRILNYGIAGAIFFRLIFILVGFALLKEFAWVSIIFGVILLRAAWHAYKHARYGSNTELDEVTNSRTWRLMNKVLPIHPKFDGHKLTTKINGKRMLTMMAAVIILIELTDIMFAIDSVPAVLAVSPDRYIAYASNVFAILGLRSLFFVYDSISHKLWALDWALAVILVWIGSKMIATPLGFHAPISLSLGFLFVVFTAGTLASIFIKNPNPHNKIQI
jgi:tellurite resistance protein TerC